MKRLSIVFLAFLMVLSCSFMVSADSIEITFNTDYQSGNDSYVITGTAPESSNVLLTVYSPIYNMSTLDGLYYFEAKNNVTGAYSFTVPMEADAPIGTYIFKVSVNGVDAGVAEQAYTRGVIGDNEVKKFVFDGNIEAEKSISATAVVGNSTGEPVTSPAVVIALYSNDGCLKKIDIAKPQTIVSGGEVTLTATIAAMPKDIGNYEVKAFMLADFTTIKPITKHIIAE